MTLTRSIILLPTSGNSVTISGPITVPVEELDSNIRFWALLVTSICVATPATASSKFKRIWAASAKFDICFGAGLESRHFRGHLVGARLEARYVVNAGAIRRRC